MRHVEAECAGNLRGIPDAGRPMPAVFAALCALGALVATPSSWPSKHAARFSEMLRQVSATDAQIALVSDPKERVLLRGVAAATREPEVVGAFQVLYEDLAPMRLAGDMLFRVLAQRIAVAAASEREFAAAWPQYGPDELALARRLFDALDANGDRQISRDELLASGLLRSVERWDDDNREPSDDERRTVDEMIAEVDADGDGQISFAEFMGGAARALFAPEGGGGGGIDTLQALLQAQAGGDEGGDAAPAAGASGSRRAEKSSARFESMLDTFSGWESAGRLGGGGRLGSVLRGCYAGAKNDDVLGALRLAYCEYAPLRLVGDLIFKVVNQYMGSGAKAARGSSDVSSL